MTVPRLFKQFVILFTTGILLSCSSGGGEGGTGITDVSRGTITQFGSIFVNGVEFDTTNADINLDGLRGTNSDLKLNMIVTVYGTINTDGLTGTADSVVVKEVLKGWVEYKSGPNSVVVLGQTVEISASTRFDGVTGLAGININSLVKISGFVKGNGIIAATRMELLTTNDSESKLFGVVENLDTVNKTFKFGALTVNYDSASFSGVTAGTLANNVYLEIKGTYNASVSTLFATEIENGVPFSGDVDAMEIEGFVTSIASANEISIDHVPVTLDINTKFDGGTVDDIVVGALVEAEGALVNGVLGANEIGFEDTVRIEGQVSNVDLNAQSIVFTDMPGLTVQENAFTEYSSDLPNGLADIVGGVDYVKVRGYRLDGTSIVVARRIEKQPAANSVSLQGPVSLLADPVFYILGTAIDTTGLPDSAFIKDDQSIGRLNFFSEIAVDTVVNVDGAFDGSAITWQQVEIEN